jgi:hypothetical protein
VRRQVGGAGVWRADGVAVGASVVEGGVGRVAAAARVVVIVHARPAAVNRHRRHVVRPVGHMHRRVHHFVENIKVQPEATGSLLAASKLRQQLSEGLCNNENEPKP